MEKIKRLKVEDVITGSSVLNIDDWQMAEKREKEHLMKEQKSQEDEQKLTNLSEELSSSNLTKQEIIEAKEEIRKHLANLENFENISKEIEELLSEEVIQKDYQFNSSDEQKKFIKNFLEEELSSYKNLIEKEDKRQENFKEIVDVAKKKCKSQKIGDFLTGLAVGEVSGLALSALNESFDFTSTFLGPILGTAVGVLLGYGLYLKNKSDRNLVRDREVKYASQKIQDSYETKCEINKYMSRCEKELDALKY